MSLNTEFLVNELYPALFSRIDMAFPSMEFRMKGGIWKSHYKLNGERREQEDKTIVGPKYPGRIKENGGDSLPLTDFYMQLNNVDFREALRRLSSICGLTVPEWTPQDSESYKRYMEKQEQLETMQREMKEALFSVGGSPVLQYLHERRGYKDDFIEWAGLGFCSKEIADRYRGLFSYRKDDGTEGGLHPMVGSQFVLSFPYRSGGKLAGFIFRCITDSKDKYRDAFISARATKSFHLFGLTGVNLTGNEERDRDITVVEGELDALRMSFKGINNVVAAAGGHLSPDALAEAKRRGVKRVTVLFDNEDSEEEQAKNEKKREAAVRAVREAGLSVLVASFPREYKEDGSFKKADPDEYLKEHSPQELERIIYDALPGSLYLGRRILDKFSGDLSGRELDEVRRQIISLCNDSGLTAPTERDLLFVMYADATGGMITKESLQEEADKELIEKSRKQQQEDAKRLSSDAYRLANEGRTQEALEMLSKGLAGVREVSREADFSKYLGVPTAAEIMSDFRNKREGIVTDYLFHNSEQDEERLILPPGAMTVIAAQPGHGKTRLLENLALQLSNDGKQGSVLFFTFEEDRESIRREMLNIHIGKTLSKNNLRTLSAYYREGTSIFMTGGAVPSGFKEKETEFMRLLTSGKLRIYEDEIDAIELAALIRFLAKNLSVKAVFIDHLQQLRVKSNRGSRKDEIKDICHALSETARETGLPIIVAAQQNREAKSPIEMTSQNLAEATEIEQLANTVILLWNSSEPAKVDSAYYVKKDQDKLTDRAAKLAAEGFRCGTPGQMYALLSKNRGGIRNAYAFFDFDGNTGRISPNYTEDIPDDRATEGETEEDEEARFTC